MQELLLHRVYRHFKGDYYLVEDIARDSETQEEMVVYRKLYEDGSLWVRPKEMFLSEVDHEKYPDVKFTEVPSSVNQSVRNKKIYTVKLSDKYKTDDSEEEVSCPFLDSTKGCILPRDLKPFDCSIWPLRVVRSDDNIKVVLTPTCSAINKIELSDVKKFVKEELEEKILIYAKSHPEIIKDDSDFFVKL